MPEQRSRSILSGVYAVEERFCSEVEGEAEELDGNNMMEIKILKTEDDYEAALERIEALMDAAPGSAEEEELELLAMLVERYEAEHYPIELPDPVEAIKFRMDQEGLTRKDMIKYLGSQSKVSEVLNYKRPLSLSMIRALTEGLILPAEVLIQRSEPQMELGDNQ